MQPLFANRLELVMKVLALSRGQLAATLCVDKSLVSRWLSGSSVPGNHNLARLTRIVAEQVSGFTMLDWEAELSDLRHRLGLDVLESASNLHGGRNGHASFPNFALLPAMLSSRHETAALGARYAGLWRTLIPSFSTPDTLHWEHLVLDLDGDWLAGRAIGYCYEWPAIGLVANGQLMLWLSDDNDYVVRLFSRAEGPVVDQLDGLMLAAASLSSQPPSCARVVMERLAGIETAMSELSVRAADRRLLGPDEPDAVRRAAVLPSGGLLRAGEDPRLIKSRWY